MHNAEHQLPTEGRPDPDKLPGASSLVGVDSNAFGIVFATRDALKRAGASREYMDAYRDLALSGDYDSLLALSMEVLGG